MIQEIKSKISKFAEIGLIYDKTQILAILEFGPNLCLTCIWYDIITPKMCFRIVLCLNLKYKNPLITR